MRAAYLYVLLACTSERDAELWQEPSPRPSAAMTGELPRKMRNCPNAVPSAKTTLTQTSDGIDLTITSHDPAAQRRIKALAALHAAFREPMSMLPPHTGMHSGNGMLGRCPIIHTGTRVYYEETPNGAWIHVSALSPRDVRRVQMATEVRQRMLDAPSS